MCGRFALTMTPSEIVATFLGIAETGAFPPRYNIAPTQPVLMALAGPPRAPGSNLPDRQGLLVRWGLIPSWTRDVRVLPPLFNARSETAAEKASFRAAMRHRRGLIPASGFYEWKRQAGDPKKSQAYWVRPKNGGLIAFAGLMETYSEPGGSEIDTGAILTTAANPEFAAIHHRMPVIIAPEHFSRWLDCRTQEPRDVADLVQPAESGFFEAIPVSSLVNKVANAGPEIQEKVTHDKDGPPAAPDQLQLF
ncbi:SOS response-associated peptidase [Mesorhizobium sp. NBSH29]|uniref:SOS response-associated peptidase n=1 Tax=Mesorhizobium sp. NBSH29 TaxID=2654249 RepID=UPI001896A0DA|nr:SOS response-associated peptidase [Mesorhizobium sp. NBSH29]QPC88669.1 SOS response-associated peptidase [Mesorhizobium sp. NBSH29]